MSHFLPDVLPALHRAAFNDIIFEGRNKAYGAYELRLIYPRHLKRAVAAMLWLCGALIAGPYALAYLQPAAETVTAPKPRTFKDDDERILTPPPPLDRPAPIVAPAVPPPLVPVATRQHVPPVVVPDRAPVVETPPLTMAQANAADNLGPRTTEGAAVPAPPAATPTAPAGDGAATDEPVTYSEVMPAFPGGAGALQKFFVEHTRYPALALRNGIEGKVYLKFVVGASGEVTDIVVVRGIGGGCDEEAVRVARTLPRFLPGAQNGRPVRVYFNVPIAFQIR